MVKVARKGREGSRFLSAKGEKNAALGLRWSKRAASRAFIF